MWRWISIFKKQGELRTGSGLASGIFALGLAILCLLAAIAFHFPEYLTTPELRSKYNVSILRQIMLASLLVSGTWSLMNVVARRARPINLAAFLIVLLTIALGGSRIPVGDLPESATYLGLDWFILDLLASTTIFVLLEKFRPLRGEQLLFREDWQTDLIHFSFNHLFIGFTLIIVNFSIHKAFSWMNLSDVQIFVQNLWFLPQLILCIFVADFIQYWVHRGFHQIPFLWKFHAIHHSVKTMDWLAGSRLHFLDVICTRVLVLGVLYIMGFEKSVLDTYIIIVGFQTVLNHANVRFSYGPFKHLIVTPAFHHWHHASDKEAIDKNFAAHFSFIDSLFKTNVKSTKDFPDHYGVVGDHVPQGFLAQQMYPLKK